jgi:hypothetical protein
MERTSVHSLTGGAEAIIPFLLYDTVLHVVYVFSRQFYFLF